MATSATSGMGFVTAMTHAKEDGAQLIIVGRDKLKTLSGVDKIARKSGNGHIDYQIADLTSRADIHHLIYASLGRYDRLHQLANNALLK